MTRLIDADALLEALTKTYIEDADDVMLLINNAPTQNPLSDDAINELADFWNISDIDIKSFIKKVKEK